MAPMLKTLYGITTFVLKSFHAIRGSNLDRDDAYDLTYALVHMPNLEVLDISDNPIEDDGIRSVED